MPPRLINTDEQRVLQVEGPRQLIVHDHPRRFGLLLAREDTKPFALSWPSDGMTPIVKSFDGIRVWVGVDQHVAVIDIAHERIVLSLPLSSRLIDCFAEHEVVLVLTELEAIVFNRDMSIRFAKPLPEIPDGATMRDGVIEIAMLDGQTIRFSAETGK